MTFSLFSGAGLELFLRYIHYFSGVIWIGMLYYFNFVQGEWFKELDANDAIKSSRGVAVRTLVPRVLAWFRYGALATFISGVAILGIKGQSFGSEMFNTSWWAFIGTGALLGTIMFLNVWLIIWPNQKIVIASAKQVAGGGTALPEAAAAAGKAGLASRHNTLFSLPMLFLMGAASHLPAQVNPEYNGKLLLLVLLVIIGALELNAIKGKTDHVKITSVMGVVHMGILLTAILYFVIEFGVQKF
ncbi:urate hydroxylase PuuD [Bacteriovorax sp. PP10]|uniref:Urate hydroxylase PuuD n=1 Tax=Bacteriovorax antarcticus TaxID=3088717 RepID=A0ABU5W0V0_9BACT|nr:urate hydroxylase PuuD [Bacteriovorax sp. PP10]MEA9358268.1 urate hydroxylase PuuD [Bacteriovorax sp. PP10]